MATFKKIYQLAQQPLVFIPYTAFIILSYMYFDQSIASFFYQQDVRHKVGVLNILTFFGESKLYLLFFLIAAMYYRFVKPNKTIEGRFLYLLGCVFVVNVFALVVKIILSRARPDLFLHDGIYGFYGFILNKNYWSFPSGHTMTIISVACGLGVLFPRYLYLLLVLALLVVASRVLLYFHFLSDVMTGLYLAIIIIGLFSTWLQKKGWFARYSIKY